MSGRTYTLDADLCDEWVRASIGNDGSANTPEDQVMVDAIRAQQPKPRIPWRQGLKVRDRAHDETYMLTDERRERRAVCIDGPYAGTLMHGLSDVNPDDFTLDPERWEVVE